MSYPNAVLAWHDFYLTAGAAAATLAGLLFVGFSLHLQTVVSHPEVRSLARVTLSNFFLVLLLALFMLLPTSQPRDTATELIGAAAVSLALMVRPLIEGLRSRRARTLGLGVLITRFGLSGLAYLALGAMAALFWSGRFELALGGMVGVVVTLLLVAVRNTWDLLVTVADKSAAHHRG